MNARTLVQIKKESTQKKELLQSLHDKNSKVDIDIEEVANKDLVDLSDVEESWFSKERMSNHLKTELAQIQNAIQRMDKGTFGICEDCESEIPIKRLRVRPDATLCLGCQETSERDLSRSLNASFQ